MMTSRLSRGCGQQAVLLITSSRVAKAVRKCKEQRIVIVSFINMGAEIELSEESENNIF